MAAHSRELKTELAALQAQRAQIDLSALTEQRDTTRAAADAFEPQRATFTIDRQEQSLRQAAGEAANVLSSAQMRATMLDDQINPLMRMLDAPARVATLSAGADILAERVAVAGAAVAACEATVKTIDAHLATANVNLATARDDAAKACVAAAKAGQTRVAAAIDHNEVYALEAASRMAEAELAEAQAAHAASVQEHEAMLQELSIAQGDVARLDLELALRTFGQAVGLYRTAPGKSNYDPARDLVRAISRASA